MRRKGFTLTEMLVVLAIIAMVGAAVIPTMLDAHQSRAVESGAALVQSAIVEARDLAASLPPDVITVGPRDRRMSGIRLTPDDAWKIARLPDGTIDPAQPIAYSRIVALDEPPLYQAGFVSVHLDGYPDGFTPLPGRLVLEESTVDLQGFRAEPTSWAWNIRCGDEVRYLGRPYTVSGPTAIPIGDRNPEGYVNYGPPGAKPPLDRGFGAVEWLYLANRLDDDGDGWTDSGWDGLDNDLDGLIDESDEWEPEAWSVGVTAEPRAYQVKRRPIAADKARTTLLPASVVIDATGWDQTGRLADGSDGRLRSQVPVDPYTGAVDLMFTASGAAEVPNLYGRPSPRPYRRDWIHLWIADRGDVGSPPGGARDAAVVSIHRDSGRPNSIRADGFDPAATFAAAER